MILNPFKGKNILITGGSKGIGLALAWEFAQQGANLALLARDKDALQAAARSLEEVGKGARIRTFSCDVTDRESLADAIQMSRFELGAIDGVVANSGYCHPGYFHELRLDDFDRQIDVNLRGVIYTLHFALPHLLENEHGGFIAITSSPAGNAGIFGFSAYGPTKAALNNLADTLRYEYGDKKLRVHVLMPPDTDTPGYREEVKLYPPETKAVLSGGSLLGAEYVAKKLVRGIANQKKRIAVGAEARFLLFSMRFMPKLWDWYTAAKKRSARKRMARADAAATSSGEETAVTDDTKSAGPKPEAESTPETPSEPARDPAPETDSARDEVNDAPSPPPDDDEVIVMPDDSGDEDSRQASA